MRKFLNILLLLIAFALNVSVVNAKNSTGQGGSCKDFMMAMMEDGEKKWGPNDEYRYEENFSQWYNQIQVKSDNGCTLYYTTNGNDPTTSDSSGNGNNINIDSNGDLSANTICLKVLLVKGGQELGIFEWDLTKGSDGAYSAEYKGLVSGGGTSTKPQAPTFNARRATSGDSSDDTFGPTPEQRIYITNHENEAKIYYTTDGSDPDASSMEYSGVIAIQPDNFPNYENIESITISAVAIKNGIASDIVRQQYYKTSPAPIITFSNNQIQITSHQDCYLTIDNGTGNYERQNSSSYTITPSGTMTVSVRCIEQNKLFSNIATYTYQGTTPVAAPTIDETLAYNKSGLYNFYTINNGASGLTVKYTTDGSDPKNSGTSSSFTDASKQLNKSTLDIVGDSLQIIAIAKDNNGNYSSTTKRTFYKTEMPTYTDNGTSVTFHATSTKKIYIKVDNATSWDGSYTSDKTYQKSDFQKIQVVALSSDNKKLYSDILVYENKIIEQSDKPIIKYYEDNTVTPIKKYVVVHRPSYSTTYSNVKFTTGDTPPSEEYGNDVTERDDVYDVNDFIVTKGPINGTKYNVIAKEEEETSVSYSYSDPVSFTYNSANIPVISCVDNTVTISNPGNFYTIYYTKNQADNNFHYADDSSTPYTGAFTIDENSIVCIYAVPTGNTDYVVEVKQLCEYVVPASDIWVPTSSGAKTGTFTWIQKVTFNDHVINLNFGDAIKNGNALYFNCSAITANSTWKVEFEYGSGQWTSIDNVQYSSGGHNVYYDEWLRDNSIQKSSLTGNVRIRVDSPTAGTMTTSDAGIIQYPAVNTTQKCVETGYTDCYLTTFTPFDFLDATISGFRGGNYNYLTGVFSRTDANNSYFEIPVSGLKVKNIKRLVLNYSDPNETAGSKILALRDSNGKDIVAPWTSDWTNTNNTTDETDISRIRVVLVAENGSEKPLNFTINNLKMYLTGVGTLPTSGDWDYGTWTQGSNGSNTIIQIYGNSAKILRYTVSDTRGQNEPTASSGTEIINQNSADIPVSTLADGTHYVQLYVVDYSNPPLPLGVYTWKVTKSGNSYAYEYLGKNEKALVVELDDNFELIDGEPDYNDHFLISGEPGSVIHYIFKYEDSSLGGMATITSSTVTLANDGTGSISLNTINAPVSFNSSNPLVLEVYSEKNGQTSPTATYQFVRSAVANQGQIGNTITFEALDGDADGLEYFYQYWDYTQDAFVWSEKKTDINYTFDFTVATSPKSITTISKQAGMLKAGTQALDILQFEKPDVPNITYDEGTGKVTISTDEEGAAQFPVYLIYTTDGTEPSYTEVNGVPTASNDNTVVFEGNSTDFPISETTTVKALVYCSDASKYYTFTSDLATDTFTIASEWTDWEPYGRGTWTDVFFDNSPTFDVYVRTSTKEGESNKKQIKVVNWAMGYNNPISKKTDKYKGYEDFIFNWDTETNDCSISSEDNEEKYIGIRDSIGRVDIKYRWLIPVESEKVDDKGYENGSYDPVTDTYTLHFYHWADVSNEEIERITEGQNLIGPTSATLKMEGMWLGNMEEDDNDYSAVQYSYMPQLSQYTVGLVKIDSENPNLSFTDGVCRIELDEPDGVEEFFEEGSNFVSTEYRHWDEHEENDNIEYQDLAEDYYYENEVYLYKMLDQFNFDPSDEGAYYIAVARLVPNGDGTFSYTGAYQYMPVYYSPASNWEIVGMRNYTENILAGRYCAYYESSTYKVEVQENKDIPGLFRIKNAYLNYENNEDGNFSYQYEEPAREGVYFYIDASGTEHEEGGVKYHDASLYPSVFYAQPLGVDYGRGEIMLKNLPDAKYIDGHITTESVITMYGYEGEKGRDGAEGAYTNIHEVNLLEYEDSDEMSEYSYFYLQISLPYPLYDDTPYTVDDMTAVNDDDEEKDDDVKDDEDSNYEWTIPNGGRHLDVTYDRILSNVWGTVMLPCKFEASDLKLMVDGGEYSEDAGFSLYELVGQVGSQLKFSLLDSQKAEANTPVVFKYQGVLPNDATLSIDIKDTKVVAVTHVTEPTVYRDSQFYVVNCNGWELLGTYTPVAITDNEHENDMKSGGSQLERYGYEVIKDYPLDQSYFINGNKVNQVDGGIRVRQYRSFIYDATSSGIKSFSVFFDDEKPDAVSGINHRPIGHRGGRVNLAGQRVDGKFRGIVIDGGRKKFVR